MIILGPDVSHYQGLPNWAQVKASGRDFCVIKATEGTGYIDPSFATNRRNAHAAGLIVGLYHFARAGNAAAEAAYFLQTIGALQPGEFLVLDWEVPGANPPAWCQQWLDAVRNATGVAPFIYMNQSAVRGSNWTQVASSYGLWLAVYDGTLTFPAVPYWGVPAMKQYSDAVDTPGVGRCDANVFNGTRDQLLAYGKGGPQPAPPIPPPTVQEDDMAVLRDPSGVIWMWSGADLISTPDATTASVWQKAAGAYHDITWPELDAVKFYTASRRDRELVGAQNYLLGAQPTVDQKPWLWDRIVGIDAKVGQVQAPVIDEAKLAAALLADPAAVQSLGKAIADNLQLSPRASA